MSLYLKMHSLDGELDQKTERRQCNQHERKTLAWASVQKQIHDASEAEIHGALVCVSDGSKYWLKRGHQRTW
jgi:hypothetical protein